MDDQAIINLFWAREEQAITETEKKYGSYCRSIARNILRSVSDQEECLNDTWLQPWNSLPPQRPSVFPVYLGTITRNLSLNRIRHASAQKRGANKLELAYEELQESVPANSTVEEQVAARELGRKLDSFLRNLSQKECCIFLRRYWYMDTIAQIARRYHMTEGGVKASLHRTRKKLKAYLEQEGYDL